MQNLQDFTNAWERATLFIYVKVPRIDAYEAKYPLVMGFRERATTRKINAACLILFHMPGSIYLQKLQKILF